MKRTALVCTLAACAGFFALASTPYAQEPVSTPQDFIAQAASAGELKFQAAKLALSKSRADDVQAFAQQVIDDHTKAGSDLKSLAREKNLLAAEESAVPDSGSQLAAESEGSFNAAYASEQVAIGERVVTLFTEAADHSPDADVQDYARNNLPVLKRHLEMARELEKAHAMD
ncbi:DUF4142 domain-containing protein [Pseudomonas sp. GCM10022186]|uniref:DUF4142 domain-containing protein n=1 Tax=Pseudomonas sp. GCM10022186 TaxID=3252650 RepID=UPI00360A3EF4